ncbi:MAG TPA: helix-turn-helix transcriptional regulator, partial [Stellaceae bacterium]
MPTVSAASRQLKQLRQRAGLSIREVAQALGMEHGSSYQHYEDRFKRPFLPLELVMKLVPLFQAGGVEAGELYALARQERRLHAVAHHRDDAHLGGGRGAVAAHHLARHLPLGDHLLVAADEAGAGAGAHIEL